MAGWIGNKGERQPGGYLRALRVLREVDLIAAEDTRHTRKLLSHYDIHTRLTSYHKFNQTKKGEFLLEILASGKNIALVSDAGLPGISDPGAGLVAGALEKGFKVVPVPGPVPGLRPGCSGLPAGNLFAGLPRPVKPGGKIDEPRA